MIRFGYQWIKNMRHIGNTCKPLYYGKLDEIYVLEYMHLIEFAYKSLTLHFVMIQILIQQSNENTSNTTLHLSIMGLWLECGPVNRCHCRISWGLFLSSEKVASQVCSLYSSRSYLSAATQKSCMSQILGAHNHRSKGSNRPTQALLCSSASQRSVGTVRIPHIKQQCCVFDPT